MARICDFDVKFVHNMDYEYLAFDLCDDDLYKDDFDSSDESEVKAKTLHGFEMARFIFNQSHTDQF